MSPSIGVLAILMSLTYVCFRGGPSQVFGSNVINVESWRCVSTIRGHSGDVLDVAWSPHDAWLASCSIDNTIIIWNAQKFPGKLFILPQEIQQIYSRGHKLHRLQMLTQWCYSFKGKYAVSWRQPTILMCFTPSLKYF